jgi:hypothetical protein
MIAFDLSLDPTTGDLRFDDDAGDFVPAVSHAMEAVKRIVSMERGTCPLHPDDGVDWSAVKRGSPNASTALRRVLLDALKPLATEGVLTKLDVEARVELGAGGSARYAYTVSFHDPQRGTDETFEGGF